MRRTAEIEEATNRWFIHPISAALVPLFARFGVHPNLVSLTGMGCGVLAGAAYAHWQQTGFVLLGFLLMVAWHVLDGSDGQLARLTRQQSELGKVLDGICDYVTFISVYLGLALSLVPFHGAWVWGLVAVAGLCHAVQSAAYEVQRQEYDAWGRGRMHKRLHLPVPGTGLLHGVYLRLQVLLAGDAMALDRELAHVIIADPGQAATVQRQYQDVFAAPVRHWGVMSANWRSIAIFLFCLAGWPVGYFIAEIVLFGGVCIAMLAAQRRRRARFIASLAIF